MSLCLNNKAMSTWVSFNSLINSVHDLTKTCPFLSSVPVIISKQNGYISLATFPVSEVLCPDAVGILGVVTGLGVTSAFTMIASPLLSEFTGVMSAVLAAAGSPDAMADVIGVVSGESDTNF